jgi:hypothetical protein
MKDSEFLVDPPDLLSDWTPRVSLQEGIAAVIKDARLYLRS